MLEQGEVILGFSDEEEFKPLAKECTFPWQMLFPADVAAGYYDYLSRRAQSHFDDEGFEPPSLEACSSYVSHLFARLFAVEKSILAQKPLEPHENDILWELNQVLLVSGNLTPVLDSNWSIDRKRREEEGLGLRSMAVLKRYITSSVEEHNPDLFDQITIDEFDPPGFVEEDEEPPEEEFYPLDEEEDEEQEFPFEARAKPVVLLHLNKGAGNGIATEIRNRENRKTPWVEVGVGYKLHYDPTDIVWQYVREDQKNEPGVREFFDLILRPTIRKALDARWYRHVTEGPTAAISGRVRTEEEFDNNIIYEILEDPTEWLEKQFLAKTSKALASREFEDEFQRTIKMDEVYSMGLQLQGYSAKNIARIRDLRVSLRELERQRKTFRAEGQDLSVESAREIKEKKAELGNIHVFEQERDCDKHPTNSRQKLFERIFTPQFCEHVYGEVTNLDLNQRIHASPGHFVEAGFLEIPDCFSHDEFHLITSFRSDSHEEDEAFVDDIEQNVWKLAPGGVLMTDGFQQSFTRVFYGRLDAFYQRFLKDKRIRKNFFLRVVMDDRTHLPVSVIIQRRHGKSEDYPDGYSDLQAWADDPDEGQVRNEIFMKGFSLVEPEHVLRRIDFRLRDAAYKHIAGHTHPGDTINLVQTITHQRISRIIGEALTEFENATGWTGVGAGIRAGDVHYKLQNGPDIFKKLEASIQEKLDDVIWKVRGDVEGVLQYYDPAYVHTFGRVNVSGQGGYNQHCQLAPSELAQADNSEFNDSVMIQRLERKKEDLFNRLKVLRRNMGNKPPILLTHFTDCCTHELLRNALFRLLGEDVRAMQSFVSEWNVNLANHSWPSRTAPPELGRFLHSGGIFFGGGSWFDVYEGAGQEFLETIAPPLVEALYDPDKPVVAGGICFSYQLLSAAISRKLEREKKLKQEIDIVPGMLELCPAPITLDSVGQEIFPDIPIHSTVAMTHSGHLRDKRRNVNFTMTEEDLRPIATSRLTGKHAAFVGANQNCLGVQWHPEISLLYPNIGVNDVINQLRDRQEALRSVFGIDIPTVMNNWNHLEHVKADSGDHILVDMLLYLVERLEVKLGVGKPPKKKKKKGGSK